MKEKNTECTLVNVVRLPHRPNVLLTWNAKKLIHINLLAVFILEDALSVWTNLGKHSLFVWLLVCSVKTDKRRIIRLDELSSVVHRSSRTTEESSSTRITSLVPVFTLQTHNQTNNECLPKFVQTD